MLPKVFNFNNDSSDRILFICLTKYEFFRVACDWVRFFTLLGWRAERMGSESKGLKWICAIFGVERGLFMLFRLKLILAGLRSKKS